TAPFRRPRKVATSSRQRHEFLNRRDAGIIHGTQNVRPVGCPYVHRGGQLLTRRRIAGALALRPRQSAWPKPRRTSLCVPRKTCSKRLSTSIKFLGFVHTVEMVQFPIQEY